MLIVRKAELIEMPGIDREFFKRLTGALESDRGHNDFPIDISYHYKSTSGWASEPDESWVVRPRYNLRDATQGDLFNPRGRLVYSAGDGNITSDNPLFRFFQLFGMHKAYPDNQAYIWHHDDEYFQLGSEARKFMKSQGLDWLFRFNFQPRSV